MAGHSQFKNIMFRKNRQDAQKSKLFSKLSPRWYDVRDVYRRYPMTNCSPPSAADLLRFAREHHRDGRLEVAAAA
jgi:hypothetical protein